MNVSELFIRRPIATSLLMVAVLLAGLAGYTQLPVSALPEVDYPTIVVNTALPGASADTMVSTVTTPLERQFGQIPSLAQMTSVSSFGTSLITLQFTLDRNIDSAEQDVQAAINAATNYLPKTLPTPPTYSKSNPADTPVLTLSVTSSSLPISQVDDYADSILAQKISQVSGVGLVTINGGQKPAVRVQVDPVALAGLGLDLETVRAAIAAANVNEAKGNIDGPRRDYALQTNDQLQTANDYKPIIIAYRNGSPIRLDQVARVVDGVENSQLAGWAGKEQAVILNVQRQPGANVIQVADSVKALLPRLAASMPQGIKVKTLADRTETIRASVEDVQFTLVLTILLVVLVIFVFLRNLRATVIPSVAVPLSLVGTFGLMYLFGYSLNNLSLMALTISTGFVVDDAIVMIENISRFMEMGDKPFVAALKGAKQIGFTIISLTISLVAVLIPLLFMSGLIGRLFREFAVTLATAIGVSALLSLTLTPMMCAHLLKPHEENHGRFYRWSEKAFDGLLAVYDVGLRWVLRHQVFTLLVTLGTVALTGWLAVYIPKGFFPEQDTGQILGVSQGPMDASFKDMVDRQQALSDIIQKDPDVASVASFIGADGTNTTPNSGRFTITLKPRNERKDSADDILHRLQPQLDQVHGIEFYGQSVQDLQIDTRISSTQYQYTMEDASADEINEWAPKMLSAMKGLPQLRDVASDQQSDALQLAINVDRDTAYRLGLSTQYIDDTLYDAFGQRQISLIFTQLNLYRVILEILPELQALPNALDSIFVVATPPGATSIATATNSTAGSSATSASAAAISAATTSNLVSLGSFAHRETQRASLSIAHQGQFPAVTLSFNLAPGASLGQAVEAIHAEAGKLQMPPSINSEFTGAAKVFQDSLASEPILILAALLTVYIVLGVLYESFIHPITILSTLPSAGVGAFVALMVCGIDFSIIALIGIVLLIGIVKKNAIMMIDFALEAERDQHMSQVDAIYQACRLRFRPIMMTTMAALLGAIPLAIGQGTGSELRRPLGISIVGGLMISQVLTLYTTPVIYLMMSRLGDWLRGETRPPLEATPSEPPPEGAAA